MKEKRSLFSAIPAGLIWGILAAVVFYFALSYSGFNEYKAKSKIITTDLESVNENASDAKTYAATINSNKIKKTVLDNLGIDMSLGMLDTKLKIEPIEGSSVVDIVVTDTNKQRAEDIADEYAEITVSVINELYKADSLIIDNAYPNATLVKTTNKDVLKMGLAGFLTYFIFGSLLLFIRNSRIDENEDNVDQRVVRKVVFEDNDTDNYDYEEDSYDDVINEENFEDSYVKEYEADDEVEDYNNEEDEIQEEKVDYDQSFKYVDTVNEDDEDFEIYENKENNKDYTIIADIPKYNDGDLDV